MQRNGQNHRTRAMKKDNRGGKRKGSGRPKVKDKRVTLNARVHPETKKRANKNKGNKSLGKYLDEIIP